MPPVVGYWNIHQLGMPIRCLLHYVGEEYEEKIYRFKSELPLKDPFRFIDVKQYVTPPDDKLDTWFPVRSKQGLDYPNIPYYIDGDLKLTHTTAILRYLGNKYNMVGATAEERAHIDMVCEEFKEMLWDNRMVCSQRDRETHELMKEKFRARLRAKLAIYDAKLGEKMYYTSEQQLTIADFMVYSALFQFRCGHPELMDTFPKLKAFMKRFEALPAIKKYMESEDFKSLHYLPSVCPFPYVPYNTIGN